MEQILISVETIQQRDKVVEVLENAAQDSLHHVGGELDFPLDVQVIGFCRKSSSPPTQLPKHQRVTARGPRAPVTP